jgi:hypothetical protein
MYSTKDELGIYYGDTEGVDWKIPSWRTLYVAHVNAWKSNVCICVRRDLGFGASIVLDWRTVLDTLAAGVAA